MDVISIKNARTHNLKNLTTTLPKNQLVVVTGRSGSGKSSLAFDTLYAEGQRRYVESLSPYARQFLSMLPKPPVDKIEGLSPAIAIDQKGISHNPRSTVGTLTEISDYLRVVFARLGSAYCPVHQKPLTAISRETIVSDLLALPEGFPLAVLAPIPKDPERRALLQSRLSKQGYRRFRLGNEWLELSEFPQTDPSDTLCVVVDRIVMRDQIKNRLSDAIDTALSLSQNQVELDRLPKGWVPKRYHDSYDQWADTAMVHTYYTEPICPNCGFTAPPLTPQLFSFNHPDGACKKCEGLGEMRTFQPQKIVKEELSISEGAFIGYVKERAELPYSRLAKEYGFSLIVPYQELPSAVQTMLLYGETTQGEARFPGIIALWHKKFNECRYPALKAQMSERFMVESACPLCQGERLNPLALSVRLGDIKIQRLHKLPLNKLVAFFETFAKELPKASRPFGIPLIQEIMNRLCFLNDVGLHYLTLARGASTLSGGESQRIRLAGQIGSALTGVLFVLDEPSIGLHPIDNTKLIHSLKKLVASGNTLLVVEHDTETMLSADYLLEIGPESGVNGGQLMAAGTPEEIKNHPLSETGAYLSHKKTIYHPSAPKPMHEVPFLSLYGAKGNNLQSVDLRLPLERFSVVTGVSGSGKSTLINQTLYPALKKGLRRPSSGEPFETPMPFTKLEGLEGIDKVIHMDQSPLGRMPHSNAATYTGLFTDIRTLYSELPEAKGRGYSASRFSFNLPGGRCERCKGDGVTKISMHFLADMQVPCEQCDGSRYNRETREICYKGRSIDQILAMSVSQALTFFAPHPHIVRRLQALSDAGLGYLPLGQPSSLLSGGEAQRVKLSRELSKRSTGKTLYILDEPTTGLHFFDIQNLMNVLFQLRDQGNTLLVIEHNLDVVRLADWIIELGPGGGEEGGSILFQGELSGIRAISCATSEALLHAGVVFPTHWPNLAHRRQ